MGWFKWLKGKRKMGASVPKVAKVSQANKKESSSLQSYQPQSPPADDGFLTTMMLWSMTDSSSSSHDSGSSYDSGSSCDSGGCGGCGGGD